VGEPAGPRRDHPDRGHRLVVREVAQRLSQSGTRLLPPAGNRWLRAMEVGAILICTRATRGCCYRPSVRVHQSSRHA
jgi:hypothetical protein